MVNIQLAPNLFLGNSATLTSIIVTLPSEFGLLSPVLTVGDSSAAPAIVFFFGSLPEPFSPTLIATKKMLMPIDLARRALKILAANVTASGNSHAISMMIFAAAINCLPLVIASATAKVMLPLFYEGLRSFKFLAACIAFNEHRKPPVGTDGALVEGALSLTGGGTIIPYLPFISLQRPRHLYSTTCGMEV